MTTATTHCERIFRLAWREHQQIRLLLGEIQLLIAQLAEAGRARRETATNADFSDLRHKLFDSIGQLRRCFADEGADGEVAITLACNRCLDAEVSTLTVRREKLERALGGFVEAIADNEDACIAPLETLFSQLSVDLANYLSDKLDALRRCVLSSQEPAAVSSWAGDREDRANSCRRRMVVPSTKESLP